MINQILKPSRAQIKAETSFLRGARFKVISKGEKDTHNCKVWGYRDNLSNGTREILDFELRDMNLICTQP